MIWTTKDSQKIPITEMSDSHLFNAFRSLARKARFEHCITECMEDNLGFALKNLYPMTQEMYDRNLHKQYPEMDGLELEQIMGAIIRANSYYGLDTGE